MDALQYRLEHVKEDAVGSTSEHEALLQQLEEVRRGRENDRKAMRQRVRVLESHMADTKTEYDSRYWRLLVSSPDVSSEEGSSAQVQLVVQQNEVTRLQAELAEQQRQARLAREHSAFLLGLYKWRGTQAAQAHASEAKRLSGRVAQLEWELEQERSARIRAEEAAHMSSTTRKDSLPSTLLRLPRTQTVEGPALPTATATVPAPASALDAAPVPLAAVAVPAAPAMSSAAPLMPPRGSPSPVFPSEAWLEPGASPTASPRGTPALADAQAATPSPPSLAPGMTPMLRRTAVADADLNVEGTPVLDERTDSRPLVRKKKRKLLGTSTSIFQLNESTAPASPGLDVPTDLSPLPLP